MKLAVRYLILSLVLVAFPLASFAGHDNNFLVISDVHLNEYATHAMEISPSSYGDNDLDHATFETLIAQLRTNIINGSVPQPKFILLLGDIVGHIRFTSDTVSKDESTVFNIIKHNFPDTPIFYVFGNNDSLAVNYGPFNDIDNDGPFKSPYDVAKINADWKDGFLSTGTLCRDQESIFPCILNEDKLNGYYSAYISPKFRLISLNSVMFSTRRSNVSAQDAMNQLQWLEQQLQNAVKNQESVLIAMHIPPGNNIYDNSNFWLPQERDAFLKIIQTYQHNITGLLAGHTHAEELKIIKNSSMKNIAGVYFTAALSTTHGNEPSVKTFFYTKKNSEWILSNYQAFHFSLVDSNLLFNKLYNYNNYYCDNDNSDLFHCLTNITADKMKIYLSAGNNNYVGEMNFPQYINLIVPD